MPAPSAAAAPAAASGAPAAASDLGASSAGGPARTARELKLLAAAALVDKAQQWLRAPPIPSPTVKYAHASRLFCAAADAFRILGAWRRAAEALRAAAGAERQRHSMVACATLHADAGEYFSRVDGGEAMASLNTAAGLFAAAGRLRTAASLTSRVGELEEADSARASAAKSFAVAADYYIALDELPQAVASLWRAGGNLAHEEDFEAAHAAFERAARISFDDNLVRFNSPKLQLNAALCLLADWASKRNVSEQAARRMRALQSGELSSEGMTRRELTALANTAERSGAATTEAFARTEAYVRKAAQRDAWFSTGREKRFIYDVLDAAKAWSAADVVDHVWNLDYVTGLAPHELALCEFVYKSVEAGPPADLLKARRDATDLSKVVEMEEEYEEEVEVLRPMTAEELRKSGIAEELEAEAAADLAEEAADKEEEERLRDPAAARKKEREKAAAAAASARALN
jgi:hypothetical protein